MRERLSQLENFLGGLIGSLEGWRIYGGGGSRTSADWGGKRAHTLVIENVSYGSCIKDFK